MRPPRPARSRLSTAVLLAASVGACGRHPEEPASRAAAGSPSSLVAPEPASRSAAAAAASSGSATAAAGPSPSAPPAVTGKTSAATAATALAFVHVLTDLATLHEANQSDCNKLASALARFREQRGRELTGHGPAVYAAVEGDPELAKGMRGAMEKITMASMRCRENPEFERFRQSLWTNGDGGQ